VGIGAHRIGCPVGTDGRPMGRFARWARASSGSIGASHETDIADSFSETNQNPNKHIMPQEPF